MRRKPFSILFIILSLLILSYALLFKQEKQPVQNGLETVVVEVNDKVKLSDFASSMRCIKLSNDVLIKSIDKMLLDKDDNIYIQDEANGGILKFDPTGKFVTQISKRGQGPGENLDIDDFEIDEYKVVIWDSHNDGLLYYDLDGNYLHKKMYKEGGADISVVKDTICFCGSYQLLSIYPGTDKEVMPLKKEYPYDADFQPFSPFSKHGEQAYFTDAYTDTVYRISNGGLTPAIYIDFKEKNLPSTMKIDNNKIYELRESGYCYDVSNVRISDDWLFFAFAADKGIMHNCLYNRHTQTNLVWSFIENDQNGIPLMYMSFMKNNELYYTADSGFLCEVLTYWNKHNPEIAAKYLEMTQPIDEEDNPYIFVVTCK